MGGLRSGAGRRRRILVVDDHFDARNILKEFFSAYGYEVVQAEDGQQALSILRRDPPFHAILLDLLMPQMSGYAFLRALHSEREEVSHTPVVVISAVPSPLFPDKIPTFPKPVPLIDVLNKVEELSFRL